MWSEYLLTLITLITGLSDIFKRFGAVTERRLLEKLSDASLLLINIVDDAERLFDLIDDAENKINEYGKERYFYVLRQNFESQSSRVNSFLDIMSDREIEDIISYLDKRLRVKITRVLYSKRSALFRVLDYFTYYNINYLNGEFVIRIRDGYQPAFPKIEEHKKLIKDLKQSSEHLHSLVRARASLSDLT